MVCFICPSLKLSYLLRYFGALYLIGIVTYLAWVGWGDWIKEGTWVSVLNSTHHMEFSNWAPGEPNGGTKQNCARMKFSKKQWTSAKCSREFCAMCKLPNMEKFLIRGNCFLVSLSITTLCNISYFQDFVKHHLWTSIMDCQNTLMKIQRNMI